ncbi:hypothetical protein GFY24_06540 [Nocardia sp. SYP-A9097]|uniref:hypothetical protein n=1 Tax=Nocardia sp. SYP-A9097 TaxID=2663237 RepID=UPI00129A3C93|nr:hypothetical protein [Nocardia sp. SYP-A9097]MRH87125.1 hypothetical protein [Nocardia sp. SYP-A9097]
MMRWLAVIAEFVIAALVAVAGLWCWRNGVQTGWFTPTADAPGFSATRYSGPWLAGSAASAIIAGLIFIDMVARGVRTRGE